MEDLGPVMIEFVETWLMSREKIKKGLKSYFCRKHDESQKSGHSEWQTQDSLITVQTIFKS